MSLIVLQYLFPAILILIYPFFPESAYFLIKKGKYEEARKALNRTHGSSDQDLINVEMKRIEQNVHFSEELAKAAAIDGPLAWQCWRKTNRRRTLTAMMPAAAQQLIGAAFVLGCTEDFTNIADDRCHIFPFFDWNHPVLYGFLRSFHNYASVESRRISSNRGT